MFWIVDSLLMRKQGKSGKAQMHKSDAKYNKLRSNVDSGSESEDTLYTNVDTPTVVTKQPSRYGEKSSPGLDMHVLLHSDHR